jgi:L-lysine exporter family protein LysE/ArgO
VNSPLTVVYFSGFATTFALIAAIGAQNAFVLRQGIRREHVLAVVALCSVSDLVLITAGSPASALVAAHPDVVTVARIGGAAFLVGYGLLAARRASRRDPHAVEAGPARLASVVGTCLALTFLKHVYLDTVVLLGALANEHHEGRWIFGVGAITASFVWFTTLGFSATGSATCSPNR